MTPYISVSDATAWLAAHVTFMDAWINQSSKQAAALEEASDHIDDLALKGECYSDAQDRKFPRVPDRVAQVLSRNSEIFFQSEQDWSEVPQEVKDACCLEALEILKQGNSLRRENQEQDVQTQTISGSSETYTPGAGKKALWSIRARQKMKFWIAGAVEAV